MYNLDLLREVAKTIKHCGDCGNLFWNEKEQKIFWTAGDSDGDNNFMDDPSFTQEEKDEWYTTPIAEIKTKFLTVPFVKTVDVDAECYPEDLDEIEEGLTDWTEIKY